MSKEVTQLMVLYPEARQEVEDHRPALEEAVCKGEEAEAFSINDASADAPHVQEVTALCRGCDYRLPCLFDSIVEIDNGNHDATTVRGGTTPRQRKDAYKRAKKLGRQFPDKDTSQAIVDTAFLIARVKVGF